VGPSFKVSTCARKTSTKLSVVVVMRLRGKVDIRILVIKHSPEMVERPNHMTRLPFYP
jgi:hypothetical protein